MISSSTSARLVRLAGQSAVPLTMLLCLVSLGCYGGAGGAAGRGWQGNAANAGRPFDGAGWQPVDVQAARFRVRMPIEPEVKTERSRADDGTPLRVYSARVQNDRSLLSFVVTDIDRGVVGDPVDVLNDMARSFLGEVDRFDVVASKEITYQGLIGIEMRSREPDEGVEIFSRHFVGRYRMFTLIAAVRADAARASEPMIDYYFRSLSVSTGEGIVPSGAGTMGSAWTYVTPARDDFSVRLPGTPSVRDVTLELDGESVEGREYRVALPDGTVSFVARVYRFERRVPESLLDKAQGLAVASGRVVRERSDVQRQGYAGSAVVYTHGGAAEHTTYFQTMSRLYEFTVTNPTSREAELAEARSAFLRSIRIH